MTRWKWAAPLLACASLYACGSPSDATTIESGSIEQSSAATDTETPPRAERGKPGNVGVSVDYAYSDIPIAGVAGGKNVVFVGQPINGKVMALDRFTGEPVGELPSPAEGFAVPFIIHTVGDPDEGRVTVLGAGGYPSPKPFLPANPTLYEFSYRYDRLHGFRATRTRDISFASVLVGFAEDFVHLDDGRYLVSDAILGSIWVVERDGTISPGIVPKTFLPEDRIPQLAFCETGPTARVNGYPFRFTGGTQPGVSPLAVRRGTVYFNTTCGRGLYRFPLRILRDQRQPYERARDIRLVQGVPAHVDMEELLDFTFHPYDPSDHWLYAADALKLRIIRIDLDTGRRQIVAEDARRFDFPSSLGFLPPIAGVSPIVVVSNQQERSPLTNDAVTTTTFQLPFIVAKVFVP
ncbi:PQQ-like beta-propeller repeat protein [Pendulispora rubella]|uniref:PQQ-like beta-propeller repeat protein n=1 Tax=Pendulispora rubella TaxID=2741070 RepID=A0ABZ2LGE7_9BACT